MKIKVLLTIVIVFIVTVFLSGYKTNIKQKKPYQAGVVISFDDAYIDEWYDADKDLKKYNWKATFCVCKIDSLNRPQINKLLKLQKQGHEIAGHGYHHYNAVNFVQKNGIKQYLKQEINPMIKSMKRLGFKMTSFAYPYGERSDELDNALNNKFKIIRGRAFCGDVPEKEGCYFRGTKFMYAFDIDNNHIHFSIPYLIELMEYAKKNDKILILCSHRPVKNVTENYQTKFETLEFICNYVKQNNLKFYTLSDLDKLK